MGLTPERWEAVLGLHAAASLVQGPEREQLLASCPDALVRAEVERMLAVPDSADFLEPPEGIGPSGQRELGDFALLQEIGRGGMGVVWLARQKTLGRLVAVKVLRPGYTLSARDVERFTREPRAVGRLSHPNLVSILTVGEEHGERYFAMEYVDGESLAVELERLRAARPAPADRRAHLPSPHGSDYFGYVAELIRQAADALAYAHEHGIVHRDVKPSNLLLDPSGRLKVVDFGVARDEEQGKGLQTGEYVPGTLPYMSPERVQGQPTDRRADVYSLGVVLYELLTLRLPHVAPDELALRDRIARDEPARVRKLNLRVPRDLETICLAAMAKGVRQRYQSAAELRDDLRRFLSHEAVAASPPGWLAVLGARVRRHRLGLVATAAVVAAAYGGFTLNAVHARSARLEEVLRDFRAALALSSLEGLPPARLLELKTRLEEARSEPGVGAEERATLLALDGRLGELRESWKTRGLADLEAAKDPRASEGVREQRRLSGWYALVRATHLFPEDAELRRLADQQSLYPTLTVTAVDPRGHPAPARAFLRLVDEHTSAVRERVPLGDLRGNPTPVPPGYYRVTVVFEQGGFRELIRDLGAANMEVEARAQLREDEAGTTRDMVRIPEGTYAFQEGPIYGAGQVDLEAFWIDATEVSNRKYWEFTQATGRRPALSWRHVTDFGEFLAEFGAFPVVGISWLEAVEYAEWRGKRLPTSAEWLRAARGTENSAFPYAREDDAPRLGNVSVPTSLAEDERQRWLEYLRCASPVTSHPEARTPEGLHHMLGNVEEWVESTALVESGEVLVPSRFDRLCYGLWWDAASRDWQRWAPSIRGIGPKWGSETTGFRCAKSASP